MFRPLLLLILLSLLALGFACGGDVAKNGGGPTVTGTDSPTESYKRVFNAVKSKNTETIKKELSKKTIEFGLMAAAKNETPIEKMYENGFTGTTFSDTMPKMRDERIKDNMGAVEVWNSKETRWEDIPFIYEDGAWKLAFGDAFAGSYVSPGHGQERRERDAANAAVNNAIPPVSNSNTNASKPKVVNVPMPPVPDRESR